MRDKIPIYCVPGLGAKAEIFEFIKLPESRFELHCLEWQLPESPREPLRNYVRRMKDRIRHENPVLLGVSFGGIVVQELAGMIKTRKVFIVSSIKDRREMPGRLRWLRRTKLYKLFPVKKISRIDDFTRFTPHPNLRKKAEMYNRYMGVRDEIYLNWSIEQVLSWEGGARVDDLVHIHGMEDEIFPIKYIEDCIAVEGATHALILTGARKISEILLDSLTEPTAE